MKGATLCAISCTLVCAMVCVEGEVKRTAMAKGRGPRNTCDYYSTDYDMDLLGLRVSCSNYCESYFGVWERRDQAETFEYTNSM